MRGGAELSSFPQGVSDQIGIEILFIGVELAPAVVKLARIAELL